MNKKLVAALSGGTALVLALSGCSDNSEVNDYAKKVCDQLEPQLQKITDANESITSTAADGKPADIKKADSAAFQQISTAYASMAGAVDKAGAPPVDDGEQKQQAAVRGLNATSRAYADLKADVERLNTNDQGKFASGLQDIAQKLDAVNKTGDDAIKNLQSGEVGEAMSKQSGCKRPSEASPSS
ncbi:small secreted protein [Streptomyces meridianus]|uniref:Small secreted protein n=1 Tax=Streptomyces meridianus TaxID=2938945 RepID=A0ABT0X5J0_9ACTN|nr:small secreted protein [Streptomyces meridianus]MCM2577694.1 small secreted protein [Streptomyces meridianus]